MIGGEDQQSQFVLNFYEEGYEYEKYVNSEDAKRIKRDKEYTAYVKVNEAATDIQKVFKSHLTKNNLIRLVTYKYEQEMFKPSLRLQSIFR